MDNKGRSRLDIALAIWIVLALITMWGSLVRVYRMAYGTY